MIPDLIPMLKFYGLALLGFWVLVILFWVGVYFLSGGHKK